MRGVDLRSVNDFGAIRMGRSIRRSLKGGALITPLGNHTLFKHNTLGPRTLRLGELNNAPSA